MNTENRTELPLTDKQRDLEDAIADFIDAHPDCTQDCFETIRTLFRRSAEQSEDAPPKCVVLKPRQLYYSSVEPNEQQPEQALGEPSNNEKGNTSA